jgi:serine/threonine protein kinase
VLISLPAPQVKLIDLGMAGLHRANKPVHGCMGSPGCIAPEVVLGEAHTVRRRGADAVTGCSARHSTRCTACHGI